MAHKVEGLPEIRRRPSNPGVHEIRVHDDTCYRECCEMFTLVAVNNYTQMLLRSLGTYVV